MEIEKIVNKWAREQDTTTNLIGLKIFQITEQNLRELKERLIKQIPEPKIQLKFNANDFPDKEGNEE